MLWEEYERIIPGSSTSAKIEGVLLTSIKLAFFTAAGLCIAFFDTHQANKLIVNYFQTDNSRFINAWNG